MSLLIIVIPLFLLPVLPVFCVFADVESQKQMELQSAIVINQQDLSQQSEVLSEVLNTTCNDQRPCCYIERLTRSMESLVDLKDVVVSLLNKNNLSNKRSGCPYPFTEVVYECFYAHPKKLTWQQARRVCQGMGGDLAEPENLYALQAYLADTFGPSYFWVGGSDLGSEGLWKWISGRPVDSDDWLFSRPDNLAGDEHCLEIVMSDYPKLFNDETCSVIQRFICQYRH